MIRPVVIGMAIIVFTLTGCTDNRDTRSLRSAYTSLSKEVTQLQARVKAVEEACLQLNARLIDAGGRKTASGQSISKPAATHAQRTEQLASLSETHTKLTRSSFSRHLVGMTVSEVLTMLGKPDKTGEDAGSQSWTYNAVRLTTESGGPEMSPALIIFEQGCVSRAVLTKDTQYYSEPEKTEASNAVVQPNP